MPRQVKYILYKEAYKDFYQDTNLSVSFACTEQPSAWQTVGYINKPTIRDVFILHYCHTGHGILTVDEKEFPVHAGQAFISSPGCVTTLESDRMDPWAFTWVCFRGSKVEQYCREIGIDTYNPLLPWEENAELHDFMLHGVELYKNPGPAHEFELAAFANELFARLVYACAKHSHESSHTSPHRYISQAIGYIDSNLRNRITVSDIAAHVGLNRTYFSMLFHKETGQTPQEFLIQHRMKKACVFFENPHATVSSVAYSLGYEPHVFSRVFKQTLGKTPQEYKKELKNKQQSVL